MFLPKAAAEGRMRAMNHIAIKLAASSLAIGLTMVGCTASADMYRPSVASASVIKSEREATRVYAKAQEAARRGANDEALALVEQAVALSPEDLAYRMALGDLYVKAGRFRSAATSYADVITLNPGNVRAGLNLALAEIALGENASARVRLAALEDVAAPSDVGLAYALAGDAPRAIGLLEPAARAEGADGRIRQNLALAYAVAGDWAKARATAAQDVSPAELQGRMEQWSAFVQPRSSYDQVASLLGVTPAADAGQPVRLALARAQSQTIQLAEMTPAEAPAFAPEPIPVVQQEEVIRHAHAVQTLTNIAAPVIRASVELSPQAPVFAPTSKAPRIAGQTKGARASDPIEAPRRAGIGRYAVQIGAFGTAAQVETAWAQAYKRYDFGHSTPLSTTVDIPGKGKFHRLSVAGFDDRAEADRVCRSVKAKGGACFVRATAGDRPVQWASRYVARG